jgi:hypothetical protein
MNASPDPESPVAPTGTEQKERGGLSRRSMVVGAAWAVPVLTLAVAAPAAAASVNASLSVSGPGTVRVGASLSGIVATVLSQGGFADNGESVTFTVLSGPASFAGGGSTGSSTTGPDGTASPSGLTTTAAGTVSVQVSVAGLPPRVINVTVTDNVVLTLDNPTQSPAGGTSVVLTGTVTVNGTGVTDGSTQPVTLTITSGTAQFAGGVQTVTVNPTNGSGAFSAAALTTTNGYIGEVDVTASTPGAITKTYVLTVGFNPITDGDVYLTAGTSGSVAAPYIHAPTVGVLTTGTTVDVSWPDDPSFTPTPHSGWSMTSLGTTTLGANTYRFVVNNDIAESLVINVVDDAGFSQYKAVWSGILYIVSPTRPLGSQISWNNGVATL